MAEPIDLTSEEFVKYFSPGYTEEEKKRARNAALLQAGLGMMEANSRNRTGGLGAAMGGALLGMPAYWNALEASRGERQMGLQNLLNYSQLRLLQQQQQGLQNYLQSRQGPRAAQPGAGAITLPMPGGGEGTFRSAAPSAPFAPPQPAQAQGAPGAPGVPESEDFEALKALAMTNPQIAQALSGLSAAQLEDYIKRNAVKWQQNVPTHPITGLPMTNVPSIPETTPQGMVIRVFNPATGQYEVRTAPGSEKMISPQDQVRLALDAKRLQMDLIQQIWNTPVGSPTYNLLLGLAGSLPGTPVPGEAPPRPGPAPGPAPAPVPRPGPGQPGPAVPPQAAQAAPRAVPTAIIDQVIPPPGVSPKDWAEIQKKRREAEPSEERKLQDAQKRTDIVSRVVSDAIKQVGFFSTGFIGQKTRDTGGTPAFQLNESIKTLQSNIGSKELNEMRAMTPTGASGYGQLAIQELIFLQAALASLDSGQNEAVLRKNLLLVKKHFEGWRDNVMLAHLELYGRLPP